MSTAVAEGGMVDGDAGTNRVVVLAADIAMVFARPCSSAAVARTAGRNTHVVAEVAALGSAVWTEGWSMAEFAADYTVTAKTRLVGCSKTESPWLAGSAGSAPVRLRMWASGNSRCAVDEVLERPSGSG